MTTKLPKALALRERDEIARSASDATHVGATDLRMLDIERYLDPPQSTPYPLEYCYYLLGDVRGRVVLDYGCGDGLNTVALARRGALVIGLDISPHLIDVAKRRLAVNATPTQQAAVQFRVGSAHELPIADESVDVVFGIAILHHLDLKLAAREVLRVLKPGGHAIFQEPLRNSSVVRAIRRLIPYKTPDVSPDERPLTDAELDAFAAPFRQSRSKVFMLPTTNLVNAVPALRRLMLHACYRWDSALLRRFGPLRHYASVRVTEVWK